MMKITAVYVILLGALLMNPPMSLAQQRVLSADHFIKQQDEFVNRSQILSQQSFQTSSDEGSIIYVSFELRLPLRPVILKTSRYVGTLRIHLKTNIASTGVCHDETQLNLVFADGVKHTLTNRMHNCHTDYMDTWFDMKVDPYPSVDLVKFRILFMTAGVVRESFVVKRFMNAKMAEYITNAVDEAKQLMRGERTLIQE